MIARPTEPYPFPISPHSLWVLAQLIETPRKWNLDGNKPFHINSFNDSYPPCTENDYYTYEILQYLKSKKVIKLHTGDGKGIREYPLPIPGSPKQRMVEKWQVTVRNDAVLRNLYNKLVYRYKVFQTENIDVLNCRFYVSDDAVLWMKSEIGHYPLRLLYKDLAAYKVLYALCQYGVVELDEQGRIKGAGEFEGTAVKSLQETLNGVGFDKILKDKLFLVSTRDKIAIKMPWIPIRKHVHVYLTERFEDITKIRQNLHSARMQKRKSLRNYTFDPDPKRNPPLL